ncbi:hypothetical protein PENTCL1PPCAC_24744, partial [Pristionchus entomophagus]
AFMDGLSRYYFLIHLAIFVVGFTSNLVLLIASFRRTPKLLKNYSILIKLGALNDLICISCDFFTMQRVLIVPGNILYLSEGPCAQFSIRTCHLVYSMQLTTLMYSHYVMLASFAFRLWVLHRRPPSTISLLAMMIVIFIIPAFTGVCAL